MHASRFRLTIANANTGFSRTSDVPADRVGRRAIANEIKAALGMGPARGRRRG